jgi:GGDEF domain-containing protein
MPEQPELHALHTAVNCYLSALLAIANCVNDACPEVGAPYRHRLSRMSSRLAFDSTPEALEDSCRRVEAELREYAARTSGYVAQHSIELRATIGALAEVARFLGQRQDFYCARLRQFATQMETTLYPTESEHLQEVIALQAAGLLSCVESMNHETQSLVTRMHGRLEAVDYRLKEVEVTDPLTGVMNRREMERQLEARRNAGTPPVLLHFQLTGEIDGQVLRQAAARLNSQFRHNDLVCRWSDTEFLVLFEGPLEIAQSRAVQIVPWIAGRYVLDDGLTVEIGADVSLAEHEMVG